VVSGDVRGFCLSGLNKPSFLIISIAVWFLGILYSIYRMDLSGSSKRVRISVPQTLIVFDYFLKIRAVAVYHPNLRLINLPRFYNPRFKQYHWLVVSKEQNKEVSLYMPLGEQGILAGDTLEIWKGNAPHPYDVIV